MDLNATEIAQLTAYHRGELSEEDTEILRRRVAADSAFHAAVAEWEITWVIGFRPTPEEEQLRQTYRDRIERRRATLPPLTEPPPPRHLGGFHWLLLLLLLILLGVALYSSKGPAPPPADRVLAELGPAATRVPELISDSLSTDDRQAATDLARGLRAYETGDYERASRLLADSSLLAREPLYRLYAASAARQVGRPDAAIGFLAGLVENPALYYYRDEIRWQLALAYYDDDQPDRATPLLRTLAETGESYRAKALTLLRRIERR